MFSHRINRINRIVIMTARNSSRGPGLTLRTWQHYTNAPMFVLSAFFLFAYSWQILAGTHTRLCNLVINTVWVLYGIDYAVSLYLAPNRWSWFKSNLILLITMILPMFQPLRLLRFVPMLHMFNRSAGTASRGRITLYAVAVVSMLIYVGALAEYSVEHKAPGATITSFPLSVWWAFVTVTTVGYGDVYPVTTLGRFIAIILMITGIAVIGIVSAMISSWLIDQVNVGRQPMPPLAHTAKTATSGDTASKGAQGATQSVSSSSQEIREDFDAEDYTTGDEDIIDAPDPLKEGILGPNLNTAQSKIMQAELLRLTDSVNRLHNEIERMRRAERRHAHTSGQTARKSKWRGDRSGHMPPHDSHEGDEPA
ncbi:potassium transporter Kef [Bifidobacterium animalis subsp. animalis]|nr:potassium transporter Kef [Bifidobacterium animalis subsp. animalis]